MTFLEKVIKGRQLYDALFVFGRGQLQLLPKWDKNEHFPNATRHAVAKSFIVSTLQLAGQIIDCVKRRSLFISLLGLRTILEFDINARYVFNHPMHKRKSVWIDSLCEDMLKTTNNLKASKNKIGEKSLKKRAAAVGLSGLYEVNYASLSDYSHHTFRNGLLNEQPHFEKYSIDCIAYSLCHANNVLDSISNCYDLPWNDSVEKKINGYFQHLDKEIA